MSTFSLMRDSEFEGVRGFRVIVEGVCHLYLIGLSSHDVHQYTP